MSASSIADAFADLGLCEPILRALRAQGYAAPTPIQLAAIPVLLRGRDLLGIAQTGTGKTAAFALPILQRLAAVRTRPRPCAPRALVLTPTRELACQIADSFRAYGAHLRLRCAVVHGGVAQGPQERALRGGVDVLVATPGRLLDLVSQRCVELRSVEVFVLDEADRMLDMGFVHDVRRVIQELPPSRQSLLFSATMPPEVERLIARLLRDPARVEVTPAATTVERIAQRVFFVDKTAKRDLLAQVLRDPAMHRTLVFTRTKHGANRVAEHLRRGAVRAEAIHGNKSQGARQRALDGFRRGTTPVLVATDIAARGIDVDGITHVVNFDLPAVPETYVHRIGRTARAGRDGVALSFCDHDERTLLRDIERLIRRPVEIVDDHPHRSPVPAAAPAKKSRPEPRAGARGRGRRRRRR